MQAIRQYTNTMAFPLRLPNMTWNSTRHLPHVLSNLTSAGFPHGMMNSASHNAIEAAFSQHSPVPSFPPGSQPPSFQIPGIPFIPAVQQECQHTFKQQHEVQEHFPHNSPAALFNLHYTNQNESQYMQSHFVVCTSPNGGVSSSMKQLRFAKNPEATFYTSLCQTDNHISDKTGSGLCDISL